MMKNSALIQQAKHKNTLNYIHKVTEWNQYADNIIYSNDQHVLNPSFAFIFYYLMHDGSYHFQWSNDNINEPPEMRALLKLGFIYVKKSWISDSFGSDHDVICKFTNLGLKYATQIYPNLVKHKTNHQFNTRSTPQITFKNIRQLKESSRFSPFSRIFIIIAMLITVVALFFSFGAISCFDLIPCALILWHIMTPEEMTINYSKFQLPTDRVYIHKYNKKDTEKVHLQYDVWALYYQISNELMNTQMFPMSMTYMNSTFHRLTVFQKRGYNQIYNNNKANKKYFLAFLLNNKAPIRYRYDRFNYIKDMIDYSMFSTKNYDSLRL